MRDLLFLCQRIPYPPNKGEKIRAFRILDHLSRDYRIHLGCFIDDPADWAHRESLAPLCATAHFAGLDPTRAKLRCLTGLVRGQPLSLPYFRDAGLAAWTADVLDKVRPDVAFVYSSAMAQYLLAGDTVRPPRPRRVVMDFVDVDSDKWRQYAPTQSWPFSAIYRREAETLLRFDRAVAAAADAGLFVSEPESALFRGLAPESAPKIHTVANGIDAAFFDPGAALGDVAMPAPALVFTGTMDYWPNVDAVVWFAEAILPRIRAVHGQAGFVIVGANPAPKVAELARLDGVTVTGRVDDVRPYIAGAAVSVAPVRIARGIQNKVLEAMAMARPVVTTAQALEGIDAAPGRDLVLAPEGDDAAAAFADAVLGLLAEPDRAARTGQAARDRVVADYSWPAKLAVLDRLLA